MAARSEIILSNQTHPDGITVESLSGEKFKGDGYYGRSDGIHTVQWNLANFVGSIGVQGTLAVNPTEEDWFKISLGNFNDFSVGTTGKVSTILLRFVDYKEPTSGPFVYNFIGNYVWVRANVFDWTSGTIKSVIMSH
jgi:hypothetical protein